MMIVTHTALSIAGTALTMGTADPVVLGAAALAAQLPDMDTSKSLPGRILFPVSRWLEKRFPHRSVTHSLIATGLIAFISMPLMSFRQSIWQAVILGYFFGWFGDVFTKSGVCAFYPSSARLVIPGNPRMRLSTGSGAEVFVFVALLAVAIATININSNGGVLTAFNKVLGVPSGAVEIVGEEGSKYLMIAQIRGRNAITQQRIDASFEVIKPLTQNDLLVRDSQGIVYRAGVSQESQILASQIQVQRSSPISVQLQSINLDSDDVYAAVANLPPERTYITGTLTIEDSEDLQLRTNPQQFNTITLQPAQGYAIAHLVSASPQEVAQQLGSYFASGSLIVRTINVRS
ncbi:metal-dependent hydrolase [Acaryochloris sp. CCMEE 5410]|uniref:metal-dependent hydrolase n=1 Tax=Acaryochloris sp. CCMEE 5410 TaxID=310037 RepID=UPI0002484B7A|nr:metal-dependent hydrolase [Acaryochloris sp. CCMEE 5410]KAI9132355.1 metal-dependent hydrolase [Acaryochloris sp. CCMEE 5410]